MSLPPSAFTHAKTMLEPGTENLWLRFPPAIASRFNTNNSTADEELKNVEHPQSLWCWVPGSPSRSSLKLHGQSYLYNVWCSMELHGQSYLCLMFICWGWGLTRLIIPTHRHLWVAVWMGQHEGCSQQVPGGGWCRCAWDMLNGSQCWEGFGEKCLSLSVWSLPSDSHLSLSLYPCPSLLQSQAHLDKDWFMNVLAILGQHWPNQKQELQALDEASPMFTIPFPVRPPGAWISSFFKGGFWLMLDP